MTFSAAPFYYSGCLPTSVTRLDLLLCLLPSIAVVTNITNDSVTTISTLINHP